MITPFFTAIILIYFIYDQFEFSSVSRISFWIIPIFSLYQFFNSVKWTGINVLIILVLVLFSVAVGYYQADHTKIRLEETSSTFFRATDGTEVPICELPTTKVVGF